MSFKDVLVCVEDLPSDEATLEVAVGLARSFGAHLVGLHVRLLAELPPFIMAEYGGQITLLQDRLAVEASDRAKARFDAALAAGGISGEWRDVTGNPLREVPLHARHADLTVIAQRNPEEWSEDGLVDQLLLDAGRPVLVVPYVGRYPSVGRRALVAWNAGREAARAVADALPLLQRADHTLVVALNPRAVSGSHGDVPGADIAAHLARHGVVARAESLQAEDVPPGDMLLSRAADEDADLLVMGAYGHSRMRELVLGGVTRHVLDHMTLPVLLSH